MAHGILISDHDFLNDLICVNFNALLFCKLAVIKSLDKLDVLIEIDPNYDIVVCMTTLANQDTVSKVSKICTQKMPKCFVVFLGHHNEIFSSRLLHSQSNHLDILSLVKLSSELLKISYNGAPKIDEANYYPIPCNLIEKIEFAQEDFWKEDVDHNEYIKLASAGEPIDGKVKLWQKYGITQVFVKKEDKFNMITKLNAELLKILMTEVNNLDTSEASTAQKINLIEKSGHIFSTIFQNADSLNGLNFDTKEALTKTAVATEKMINQVVKTLPSQLNSLIELFQNAKLSFVQKHTLLTSFLCLEMSRKESWFSSQVYSTINMMVFFHDIVLTTIYIKHPTAPEGELDLLNFPGLTEKEKTLIKWHPKAAAEMVANLPGLPIGLDQLILQHHGTISGQIVDSLPQDEIAPLSKLLYVAEKAAQIFLNSKIPLSGKERKEALDKLSAKIVKKSYQKLLNRLYELNL